MIGELIEFGLLCLLLTPGFVLLGLGLRYVFYSADSWNLDSFYEKHFDGRQKKRYRRFTQKAGLILLVFGLIYFWFAVWPLLMDFFET